MLDRDTGEIVEKTLTHEGGAVRAFYAAIPPPVVVGIEATGSMGWFLRLMEELAIECRVGHPTAIRKAETRRQKHDQRDAALLLQLPPHTADRRSELQALYQHLEEHIDRLDEQVKHVAGERPRATLLMTHP